MARTILKAKTSRVNRAATSAPSSDASAYCRNLDNWPHSWRGLEKDLPPGEQLLACLRPFIQRLASSSLSPQTIRKHGDNLWMLGGEILRDLNIHGGGPLIHKGSEEAQSSLDSTCRKLHRFLSQPQR